MKPMKINPILILLIVFLSSLTLTSAKDTEWGAFPFFGDEKFSNGRNWDGGVPSNTDNVLFPSYSEPRDLDNDLVNNDADGFVGLESIRFEGSGWILSGRPFAVGALLSARNDPDEGSLGTEILAKVITEGNSGEPTIIEAADGGRLLLHDLDLHFPAELRTESRSFALFGRQHTQIELRKITGSTTLSISARLISTITNGGAVEIHDPTGQNDFMGQISIKEDGILRVFEPTGLGSTSASTTIDAGGQLHIVANGAPFVLDEPLFFDDGELKTGSTNGQTAGLLTVRSQIGHFGPGTWRMGSPITITGRIVGFESDSINFNGPGFLLTIAGNDSNLTGAVTSSADLSLEKPPGVNAVGGNLTVQNGATVSWLRNSQVPDTATLHLSNGSIGDLNGKVETVGTLRFTGNGSEFHPRFNGALTVNSVRADGTTMLVSGPGNLNLGIASAEVRVNDDLTIAANIGAGTAGASFKKTNSGTLLVTGVCSVPATIQNGTVQVTSISSSMPITLDQGDGVTAVLTGTGTVGAISAGPGGGLIEPGIGGTGILRCGNISWDSDTSFRAEVRGTTAGTGHDQLIVAGTVNLNNAILIADFENFNPPAGSSFTILSNDGSDSIIGTFSGMPQGATILGGRFTISYTGGSGNDVTLTAVVPASGLTRTWTGLGANDFWSTTQNWNPAGAPQNGDALVFPSNTPRRTNINDRSNLAVQSITISGGPFVLAGNSIALAGGITVTGTILLNHSIQVPINLTAAQTFFIGPQFLTLTRDINTNGMGLTFRTDGTPGISSITCNGIISGGAGDQFVKSGNGLLNLGGTNTTRGNFHITRGVVRITNAAALGSRFGATTVDAGAELIIAGTNLAFNEPVLLAGKLTIADNAGTVAISDPIDCAATAELFISATGVTQVNMFDELNGIALRKTGPGIMNITGAKTKSLSEGITIDEGRVVVTGTSGVIALPGNTTVRGILEIKQRNVTEADSQFIIGEGGSVICDSPEIAIAGLTMTGGTLTTDGNGMTLNGSLTVLPSATTSLLSGNITLAPGLNDWNIANGPAAEDLRVSALLKEAVLTDANLRLTGTGTSVFTANNSIHQFTAISGNTTFQGTSTNTSLDVNGGFVSASGKFLDVIVSDGTLAPGQLTVASINGTGGKFVFKINGTSSDRMIVTGSAISHNLVSSQLTLLHTTPPPLGTVLSLIDLQGSGFIVPFHDHPEASTLFVGTQRYRINYFAGTGNDVTLTALPPAPEPVLRFTGLSITDNVSKGIRSLNVTVSGGEGAVGLGIPFETSRDLINWEPLPFLLFGDASGNINFGFKSALNNTELFVRARLP
jgi:fibronectin-binding autotransporter adhesin